MVSLAPRSLLITQATVYVDQLLLRARTLKIQRRAPPTCRREGGAAVAVVGSTGGRSYEIVAGVARGQAGRRAQAAEDMLRGGSVLQYLKANINRKSVPETRNQQKVSTYNVSDVLHVWTMNNFCYFTISTLYHEI